MSDGDFAGEQRLQSKNAAGVDQLDVEAVFLEMTGVEGDPWNRR
ncbi:MAG TPA: hypothetical protein VNT76_06380 [Candidatus Binatus sp.]|nr:hypothetical protein [Candidatus Binatus sp.]